MATVYAMSVGTTDKKRRTLTGAMLVEDKGFALDSRGGGDRQVSLAALEALEQAKQYKGLCTGKFAANIVTKGLNYSVLHAGDILRIGQCVIELTMVGKPCYQECGLAQRGRVCSLPSGCAFGRVKRSGWVRTGMAVRRGTGEKQLDGGV
ncbi:MAG: MOSC domain-containing protein [Bacillota bacterium]